MSATEVIQHMLAAGLHLAVDGEDIVVNPPGRMTDQQRQSLKAHKPEIIAALRASETCLDGEGGHDLIPVNEPHPIRVRGWTPLGDPIDVLADDEAHADWIQAMNPPPIPRVSCADCIHATILAGIAHCGQEVDSGLVTAGFWATDQHPCGAFEIAP